MPMASTPPDLDAHGPDDLDHVEALLRASAPAPATAWEAQLERQLLAPGGARSMARLGQRSTARRLITATATAGALAAVVVVAGLAGGGPLAPDGGDGARAKPGCTTIYVTEVEKVGEVVRRADGKVTVEGTKRPVTREQQRCTPSKP